MRERTALVSDLVRIEVETLDALPFVSSARPHVYFSTGAVISMLCTSNGAFVEVRGVGIEGMLGAEALQATEHVRFELMCQIGGSMLSMPLTTFTRHLADHAELRTVVSRYSSSVLTSVTQTVACNGLHGIAKRCARWLLTTRDRVGNDEFALTHEWLARMLGVRRAGVSVAVYRLQRLGIIAYKFGTIEILDRARLETESCECYRLVANETKRILIGRGTNRA